MAGYFERDLKVWRQFLRVYEIFDVIVVTFDSCLPVLHHPRSPHQYRISLGKPFVIVLMKMDLVAEDLLEAWKYAICKASIYPLNQVIKAES